MAAGILWTMLTLTLISPAFSQGSQFKIPGIEILDWKPPKEMLNNFTYYLTGYDYDGSPVWVVEGGRWDFKALIEAGGEGPANYDRYFQQAARRWVESSKGIAAGEDPGFFVLVDMDGFDLTQAASVQVVQKILWSIRTFVVTAQDGNFKGACMFHVNYLFQVIWNLAKPIVGQLLENIQLFGTNNDAWKPQLLKLIPKDQLPEWYGGTKTHKPIQVYG